MEEVKRKYLPHDDRKVIVQQILMVVGLIIRRQCPTCVIV